MHPAAGFSGQRRLNVDPGVLDSDADEPFVFYSSPYAQALTMNMCEQAGFVPTVSQLAGGVPTVVNLVKCGLGVALVPRVAREWPLSGVRFVDLTDSNAGMQMGLGLAWLPTRERPACERFRDLVRETFALNTQSGNMC